MASTKARMIPFHFSTIQAYAIEFGDQYLRFYMDDGVILDGVPVYEIGSPYLEADLFEVKYIQSADVMYIFHPDYPPKKLTRTGHTAWTLTDYVAAIGDEMTITGITKADPAVVTCSTVETTLEDGDIVYIESVVGMTEVNNLFFEVASVVTGAGGTFELVGIDSGAYTTYVSGGTTKETQFGTTDNCPSCGAFFEQRLMVGGTNNNPHTIWGSGSADYENFTQDATDASAAIEYTFVSGMVDRIRWMIGQDYIMVGTTGGIWKVGATTTVDPFSNENITAKKQIFIGVKDIDPQIVTDALLWVTRLGTSLRKVQYDWTSDKWIAPDMTRVAKHIALGATQALSGIVDMDFQKEPMPILWAVRADGQLLGFTYDTQDKVFAWFRIVTDGEFESVAVISQDNQEDQVWVVVKRTIEDTDHRYVEFFKPHEFFSEATDCFFVHSGLSFEGETDSIEGISQADPAVVTLTGHAFTNGMKVRISGVVGMTEINQVYTDTPYTVANAAANTLELDGLDSTGFAAYVSGGLIEEVQNSISNLDHLEAKDVAILIDGRKHDQETVAIGAVSLDWYGNKIHAGLPYTPILEPMKLHAGAILGTSRGKPQKINKLTVVFHETGSAQAGPDTGNVKAVRLGIDAGELFSGDKPFEFPGDWKNEATIVITQDEDPLPLTVLGIVPEAVVSER